MEDFENAKAILEVVDYATVNGENRTFFRITNVETSVELAMLMPSRIDANLERMSNMKKRLRFYFTI